MKITLAFVLAGLASFVSAAPLAPVQAATGPLDIQILQYALTLEHLEANFYAEGLAKFDEAAFTAAGFSPNTRLEVVAAGDQEAAHVKALQGLLGSKAVKRCSYDFPLNTVNDFLATAQVLESVGVSAYLGAAPLISKADYLRAAASILTVEARHDATLSVELGRDPSPGAYDTPLNFSQVYSLASGFIKSCPRGNADLPVRQFPALSISNVSPAIGDRVKLTYKKVPESDTYYAWFLNGNEKIRVRLPASNSITIPKGLDGRVYVVVSCEPGLNDNATIAGPIFFNV